MHAAPLDHPNLPGDMEPTPIFDTYWRFAAERQEIYFRRLVNLAPPWTSDPILSAFRFTNAYRASDRVSQYLIREVQYGASGLDTPADLFFRTMLFKIFNRIETWEALEGALGAISSVSDLNAIKAILDRLLARGERIYSAAYIMPAPAFGHLRKHANHLAMLGQMMEEKVADELTKAPSLHAVYHVLKRYPGIGPFLAYQYAIDLNYSEFLDHDEASFVVAGPGALDGIAKCFATLGGRTAEEAIHWACDQQETSFARMAIAFKTLFGRRLQPVDCQNLFCEISKYARVAHPEVTGLSGRKRIKQVYRRSLAQLPDPTFPPRWGLKVDLNQVRRETVPLDYQPLALSA
jgi:hypothetical protein